uniref:Aquaporin-9 n=1 Tax=Syphacia muris TaxID=451379 RepID=A0A158R3S1_9BILA
MQPYVLKLQFTEDVDDTSNRKHSEQSLNSIDTANFLQKFITPPLAELVGTAILGFINMFLSLQSTNQQLTSAVYDGVITFVLMAVFSNISGAHFNPVITMAVGFIGHCRFIIGTLMIFCQLLGSFLAALLSKALLTDLAFKSTFKYSLAEDERLLYSNPTQAFFLEILFSFMIACAYLFNGVRTQGRHGQLCAVNVALTRSLVTYVGYRTVGHCANMAISFGDSIATALFLCNSRLWSLLYIAVFADMIGAFLAALSYCGNMINVGEKNFAFMLLVLLTLPWYLGSD